MSTLISDTLVSCAEPPHSRWTDIILDQTFEYWNIILDQTFEYWNGYQFTKANCLIIQSIKCEYKLIIKYIFDNTGYKSCEYK